MSKRTSRTYPTELILDIIQRNEQEHIGPAHLARDYDISINTIKHWLKVFRKEGYAAFGDNKRQGHHTTFDGKFKQRVMKYWIEHPEASGYDICNEFSVSRTTLRQWRKIYEERGLDAFLRETRGANRKVENQKRLVQSKKSEQDKIKELESQIEYLQAENEYLKKLNALTHKKELQKIRKK